MLGIQPRTETECTGEAEPTTAGARGAFTEGTDAAAAAILTLVKAAAAAAGTGTGGSITVVHAINEWRRRQR